MGGSTDNGAAGTPPIDLNTLTAPGLRGLMVELGLPVSETMTPQEAEAALALAQVLPDPVWAALLNPGMTVRLEGAQGLAENSLEASLSRVQVAPGGERSQVLELTASLAVEAGLRSEALRSAVTPELIERLPEGARETVRGWKAAHRAPLEASVEASAGERFTYQAVVPPDVGARIAEGDISAAPNPADPMGMPVGSSVLIRGEDFTANSFSARYKLLQFDETVASLEGQGIGIRRVDENIFELTTGPMEAMERDAFLGVGLGGFQMGWSKDTRVEDQRIAVAQLDLSTPEGKAAYEAFMSGGLVPERSGPGVVKAGERHSFTVDVTTGLRFGTDAASADLSADSSTQATMTRWDNGETVQQTVGHNVKGNAFEVTARLDAEGQPPAQGFDWVVTLNGLNRENAKLLGFSYGAGEMESTAPENPVADLRFTDSELMGLRNLATDRLRVLNPELAAAIESRRDDPDPYVASEQAFTPLERLVATNTPDEVFRELFVRDSASNSDTVELLAALWSDGVDSEYQGPLPGPLPGAVTIRDEEGAPVFISAPPHQPQVTTTLPGLVPPPPEAGSLDNLVVPSGTDPAPGFVAPPAMALLPEADEVPVASEAPVTGEVIAPVPVTSETLAPVPTGEVLPPVPTTGETLAPVPTGEVLPPVPTTGETLAPVPTGEVLPPVPTTGETLVPVPTGEVLPPLPTTGEALAPVTGETLPPVPTTGEVLPPVPANVAETPSAEEAVTAPAGPAGLASPSAPGAPGFDMQDGLLRLNEEGLGVLGLQTALDNQGYDVPTDMRFGPETEQALRDFQARNGLQVDGIAGPETFAALHPRAGSHMADGLIRQPDEGAGVLGTQTALRQLGHDLAADAVFGPDTERAVREFQRDHGLAVDGIVGPKTSAAMVTATRGLGAMDRAAEPHAEAPNVDAPSAEPPRSRAGAAGSGSSSGAAGAAAVGPAALSPDQQRHLQLAHEQLGPGLSARGHSPEQIERICAAAVCAAQEHAERGPVKAFHLSKDGERVAVVQQSAPMSEMGVTAAAQRPAEQHLALAQQTAHEQELAAQRRSGAAPAAAERALA